MIAIDWQQELGWGEGQLEEMRSLAYAYLREGKWSEAITLFKAIIALAPQSVEDLQTLGALYLQTGESKQALGTLEGALQLNPADEPTQLNRAKALFVLGHLQEGRLAAQALLGAKNMTVARSTEALLLAYGEPSPPQVPPPS